MELSRIHWRAMIFYNYKCGLNQSQSLEPLRLAFGDTAPSRTIVFDWFAEFRRGRVSLEDEAREGQPLSSTTQEAVAAMQALVEEDPQLTVQ
ncbi:hypothetical protein BOX15_Mlig013766g1 [Macrostomum lignano]|uniref:Mos1 transposase HTH domain-containing protein n=1 Tax=Macrostomum lignano TaxID=282301 RepID=A0A267ER07_9PLAT|nr:hypothetical protein BOX15_Mlig013766g1 [Macrostomum lignano]